MSLRVLHTSDWHLGQKFINQSREAEHGLALEWLLQTIENERIDLLIVAGDIFDVNNPPVSAEELYYRFLTRLKSTCCRHVVIIGGNHDSPSKLDAPRGLLRALDMHVLGCATEDPADEIIELKNAAGELEALVAAVPFLRDKDFKITVAGESTDDRIDRIKEGIYRHYALAGEQAAARARPGVPVLATGHLYAKGASSSGEQNNIYIGNLENIAAEQFPAIFDYVALGHIHRAQKVGKKNHIRYSGSLLPLSFSEISDKKSVLTVEFEPGKGLSAVREIPVPVFRRLLSLRGSLAKVEEKLQKANLPEDPLPAWVEIVVDGENTVGSLDRHLRELAKGFHLDILKIKHEHHAESLDQYTEVENLDALTPEEVFEKLLESRAEQDKTALLNTFRELRQWAEERGDS